VKGWFLEVFRPHSHAAADSVDAPLESSAKGIRAVKISLVALGVTALLQALIVMLTGSVALLADTIHNFSDALTAIRCGSPSCWVAGHSRSATPMATAAPRTSRESSSSR
jgi:Co/Zn/Cd efflux system component